MEKHQHRTEYVITEKQDLNSHRAGNAIQAMSLSDAKRKATMEQVFQGTVLTIEHCGCLLAYKQDGRWINLED